VGLVVDIDLLSCLAGFRRWRPVTGLLHRGIEGVRQDFRLLRREHLLTLDEAQRSEVSDLLLGHGAFSLVVTLAARWLRCGSDLGGGIVAALLEELGHAQPLGGRILEE